jgi:hypothetical protein
MGTRAALAAGTVLSVAACSAWSLSATATMGPAAPLHLTRNPLADYAALAAAPAGNGPVLLAVTAMIYAACLFLSGLRRARRERAEGGGE